MERKVCERCALPQTASAIGSDTRSIKTRAGSLKGKIEFSAGKETHVTARGEKTERPGAEEAETGRGRKRGKKGAVFFRSH